MDHSSPKLICSTCGSCEALKWLRSARTGETMCGSCSATIWNQLVMERERTLKEGQCYKIECTNCRLSLYPIWVKFKDTGEKICKSCYFNQWADIIDGDNKENSETTNFSLVCTTCRSCISRYWLRSAGTGETMCEKCFATARDDIVIDRDSTDT